MEKPFSVKHDLDGSLIILDKLLKLEKLSGIKPDVILEATGNYSKPITTFLQDAGYSVIALNPLQTHELKRRTLRKIKTDAVDAQRIADLYYLQNLKPLQTLDPNIAELRTLCRHYNSLMNLYTETLLKLQSIIDLIFPTYPQVFSKLDRDSSLRLISTYPTPKAILSASKEEIMKCLSTTNQRKGWADNIYEKLKAAARNCIPYKVAQQSNVRVLRVYVSLLMTQKSLLTDVRAQIVATAKDVSIFDLLVSIPGVGDLTAAFILSEIEDINRFSTPKQLIAFAGLDPSVFESGKFKASRNRISKRGSNYLRKALFQAAAMGIRKFNGTPVNPTLHEFYQSKVNEGKPKMVALTATSSKLLRIIYGIWRNNQHFCIK